VQHEYIVNFGLDISNSLVTKGYCPGDECAIVGAQARLILRPFILLAVSAKEKSSV
jgi:hypothetical protein